MASKFVRNPAPEKSRGELLTEVADLPPSAFIPTAHAAAYIGSSPGVMLNWRSQRRGPRYHGKNDFVRYRISDLDVWMSARANEIRDDKLPNTYRANLLPEDRVMSECSKRNGVQTLPVVTTTPDHQPRSQGG
jgi:hypothetical protein